MPDETFTNSPPFKPDRATITSIHAALSTGQTTCREILEFFLHRIETYNPTINAIIALNPNALTVADALDKLLTTQGSATNSTVKTDEYAIPPNQPLFGIPILLKDNFDFPPLPTTAGSLSFKHSIPTRPSPVVAKLTSAGAIILGKTNMHEFALEGLTVSSLGGQTRNPYDLTRTPGGSSGGSGAAVAAGFAVMATGTDTVNSLRNPASACNLYSFRPTTGLVSTEGIVPVSRSQDAAGMIGRCLEDIAVALDVMAGSDGDVESEGQRRDCRELLNTPWSIELDTLRIGVLHGFMDRTKSPEHDPVNEAMDRVLSLLRGNGTTIIDIEDAETFNAPKILATMDLQMFEIQEEMNRYLSSPDLNGNRPSNFAEIFQLKGNPIDPKTTQSTNHASDPQYLIIPHQQTYIHIALTSSTTNPEYLARQSRVANLKTHLHTLFNTHNLHAVIYPQQRTLVVPISSPSQANRNGILAALTGSPVICIPIGFGPASNTAPVGVPIGMEILGLPGMERELFGVARAVDTFVARRREPVLDWSEAVGGAGGGASEGVRRAGGRYETVPVIRPEGLASVDLEAYPPERISS